MRLTLFVLVCLLCACSPTPAKNAPAAMTADQQAGYNADIKAILDETEAEGAAQLGADFAREKRAYFEKLEVEIRPDLHRIWLANESLAKNDRRRLLANRIRERDREVQAGK